MAEDSAPAPVAAPAAPPAADPVEEQPGECSWCERMPGAVAVFAAAIIGYIGLDLLTGQKLSRALSGLFGGGQGEEESVPGDG
jgi:hypothetical protein